MKKMMKRRFTAIELILVCAVVAILFTIAMPAFSGLISGTIITRGANQVASKLSLARAKAVAQRKFVGLVFNEDSYRMAEFEYITDDDGRKTTDLKFKGWMELEAREFLPHGLTLPLSSPYNIHNENFCCGKPKRTQQTDDDGNLLPDAESIEEGEAMPEVHDLPTDLNENEGTGKSTHVIVFRPSGAVVMVPGKETNKVSMRFAEGFKTPDSNKYELKKDSRGIINYANLLISAMSGQPAIEYVQTLE